MSLIISQTSHENRWTETTTLAVRPAPGDHLEASVETISGYVFTATRVSIEVSGPDPQNTPRLSIEVTGNSSGGRSAGLDYLIDLADGHDDFEGEAPAWLVKAVSDVVGADSSFFKKNRR
jgi:hypothetical protein